MNRKLSMLAHHPSSSRPLAPGELALIGTVHFDRAGFLPLRALLAALKPSIIATEMSDFGIAFRRAEGRALRGRIRRFLRRRGVIPEHGGELGVMSALLGFPFEYLAARWVAHRLGSTLVNAGRDRDSMVWLGSLLRGEWSESALARMAATERDLAVEVQLERRRALEKIPAFDAGPRDRVYARRIAEYVAPWSRVAAILGWEHVIPDVSRTTAWILQAQMPRVYIVADGVRCIP